MSRTRLPLLPRSSDEAHRASTELELFFDLVIVVAIASVTAGFHHALSAGEGLEALPRFLLTFVAIWWAWMNYTWFATGFDNDDALFRLLTVVIMFGATIFAGGAEHIFETLDFGLGLIGWIVMRLGMILLWLRVAFGDPQHRAMALRFALGYGVAQLLWVALYFAGLDVTFIWMGVALVALLEMAIPFLADKNAEMPWHKGHIKERYGLLTIIVLGEIILSIALILGALYESSAPDLWRTAIAAMVITFAMWWIYFLEAETDTDLRGTRAMLWTYGHVFLFAAVALTGAAMETQLDLIAGHTMVSPYQAGVFLNAALATYVLALWAVRDSFMQSGHERWSLPVAAVGFLLIGGFGLPIAVTAGVAILMLVLREGWLHPQIRSTQEASHGSTEN